jgi:two-component system phosphate regulon sensor histidine kinase PhoR
VKFTPPGGEIILTAREAAALQAHEGRTDSFVRFSVKDDGQGISADDLPRIFERFYRADRARPKGGTGMGLSIARHLVESHGGTIWAESVEDQGSTIFFTIPVSR